MAAKITVTIETDGVMFRVAQVKNVWQVPSRKPSWCVGVGNWIDGKDLKLIACDYTVNLVSSARLRRNTG